jgi:hypothetical protein
MFNNKKTLKMSKKIYSTDKNLNFGKRKRIIKPTIETKINRLRAKMPVWDAITFDCKMAQKYGLQIA